MIDLLRSVPTIPCAAAGVFSGYLVDAVLGSKGKAYPELFVVISGSVGNYWRWKTTRVNADSNTEQNRLNVLFFHVITYSLSFLMSGWMIYESPSCQSYPNPCPETFSLHHIATLGLCLTAISSGVGMYIAFRDNLNNKEKEKETTVSSTQRINDLANRLEKRNREQKERRLQESHEKSKGFSEWFSNLFSRLLRKKKSPYNTPLSDNFIRAGSVTQPRQRH